MKGIDPKYIMWLGLLVAVEQAIGHGTVSLTNLVPVSWAPYITSWCNALAFIGTTIMTYQAAVSGPQTGPLLNISPPANLIIKIILVALTASFLMFGNQAQAQPRLHVTGNFQNDLKADAADLKAKNAQVAASINSTSTDPGISCDFKIFIGLTPTNLETAIKKCLSDADSTLVDDTARALDSAKNYTQTGATTVSPDNDAINCLTPGLALLRAGVIVPGIPGVAAQDAVPATATTPAIPAVAAVAAVPSKQPGFILLFQKYREFVLSGALTACQTWVNTPVNATIVAGAGGAAAVTAGAAILIPKP